MEGQPRLVGRVAEQQHIADSVSRALRGHFVTLVVEGEAGIGKSELLEHAVSAAEAAGFTIWRAKADELERERPFAVLRSMLQPDDGELRVVADGLTRISTTPDGYGFLVTPEQAFHVIDRVQDLAEQRLARAPLAVLIDDAQWADEATLRALSRLAARLADRPVLLVVATRPIVHRGELGVLVSSLNPRERLAVGPLADVDVARLVADRLGRLPSDEVLAEVARGGGNPFFVGALLEHQADGGRAPGSMDGGGGSDLPAEVRTAVLRQLDELGSETSRMLTTAAVLGGAFSPTLLADVTDQTIASLAPLLDRAVAAKVLEDQDGRLRFRHDLLREIAYESVSPTVRRALHLHIARRMVALGMTLVDAAGHFLRGADTGDVGAAAVLRRAAREIGMVAPRSALELLERAVEILPEHVPEYRSCLVELAQSCVFANEVERSAELAHELLATTVPVELELDVRKVRSQLHFLRGDARLAVDEFEAMLPLVDGDPREVVILADAAVSAMFAVDLDRARHLADLAVGRAESHDERVGRTLAMSLQSWLTAFGGDLDGAVHRATEAVRLADSHDGLEAHRHIPLLFLAQALLWSDDVDAAQAALRRGRRISTALGMGWDEPMFQALLADERTRAGEWDDALAEIESGLSRADEVGSHAADSWLHVHRARILLFRGASDAASEALDGAAASLGGDGGQGADQMWLLRALSALADDDGGLARVIAVTLWHRLGELGVALRQLEFAPDMIRIARRVGDDDFVADVVSTVDELARRRPSHLSRSSALWSRALARDDPASAAAAVTELRRRAHRVDLVRCQLDLTDICSRLGVDPSGSAGSHEAFERLERWQATGLATLHLTDPELRSASRSTASNPTTGWESLTPSERRVAQLVGQGLSNAEIAERLSISRRTVESHLYHAYPKLGLSSRVELAVDVASRLRPVSA